MRGLRAALVMACVMPGCGSPTPPIVEVEPGCSHLDLDEGSCLLPWPSSEFLVDAGTATETGRRVELPVSAMPVGMWGPVEPTVWNERDGFSAMTTMIVRIEGQIDDGPLASWRDTDASLLPGSPTVLLDTTIPSAPERVRHFAEVQTGPDVDGSFTTLYIRPAQRLEEGRHYVVAVRWLTHADGRRPRSSTTFAALQTGAATNAPALADHFERQVFGPLEQLSMEIHREELIVAWDFWTGSGSTAWGDVVAMRDDAFAPPRLDSLGCAITSVDGTSANANMRLVDGTFDVPYFLDADCGIDLVGVTGGRLVRDASGVPMSSGRTCRAHFRALIPTSLAAAGPASVPLVEYGHGLGNDFREIDTFGVVAPVLEATQAIGIATDALGLSTAPTDSLAIVEGLQELSSFRTVDDRILQGVIAQAILPYVFAHACASQPELLVSGENIVDLGRLRWIGNSQGGIMGPTIAALEPEFSRFDRIALGVGGISYPIMLPRSCDWPAMLEPILGRAYPNRIDRDLLMVMFASHWDLFEGATFAPLIGGSLRPLPGSAATPPDVLYQIAVNDPGTPEVSGEIAARTMQLPVLAHDPLHFHDSSSMPQGLAAGTSASAFVSFAYPSPITVPVGPTAPEACELLTEQTNPHEMLRRDLAAQMQIEHFFDDGTF